MTGFKVKIPASLGQRAAAEGLCLGVDEAGRGPVLGPMVYACAFWAMSDQAEMAQREFDDSKKLSEDQRDGMFEEIENDDKIGYVICELSAKSLSEQMLRVPEPISLNKIAHDATVEMISRVIAAGLSIKEIYVDAVGNCETYERMLSSIFPDSKVCVRPKADSLFKVVSAASVCAKVSRDKAIAEWVFEEPGIEASTEWGCGYPGDEKTKRWLSENIEPVFGYPSIVRFSWQTTKTILEPNGVSGGKQEAAPAVKIARVVFPAEDNRTGAPTVSEMFKRASRKRTHYFSSRGVELVADINKVGS